MEDVFDKLTDRLDEIESGIEGLDAEEFAALRKELEDEIATFGARADSESQTDQPADAVNGTKKEEKTDLLSEEEIESLQDAADKKEDDLKESEEKIQEAVEAAFDEALEEQEEHEAMLDEYIEAQIAAEEAKSDLEKLDEKNEMEKKYPAAEAKEEKTQVEPITKEKPVDDGIVYDNNGTPLGDINSEAV